MLTKKNLERPSRISLVALIFVFLAASQFIAINVKAQQPQPDTTLTHTIRGTVFDADSRAPLIGASVIIPGSEPLIGTTTDVVGNFELTKVLVGRADLTISFLGYSTKKVSNVVINAGKETILNIPLIESLTKMEGVIVTGTKHGEPINEMSQISSRSITPEEITRLTASFNDPALITTHYAGVTNSGTGGNDIIVRGNSPKYLQWRLEGMPINNPNHFADQTSVGGATSTINANLLTSSDFYTGAFPAEYGNALSGVYDIRLRNGNNQQFETMVGFGWIGTEVTLEGPLSKKSGASFLVNYRYSTATVISNLGLIDIDADLRFQDASFKLNIPTKKSGIFSLFGLMGASKISQKDITPADYDTPGDDALVGSFQEDYDKTSALLNVGINHTYFLDNASFIKSSISLSADELLDNVYRVGGEYTTPFKRYRSDLAKGNLRIASSYNRKVNARNSLQAGITYQQMGGIFDQFIRDGVDSAPNTILDYDDSIGMARSYVSWKHRFNEQFSIVAGLQNSNLLFNEKHTLEPRFSATWAMAENHRLSLGYGLHSTMESVHHYFARIEQPDGSFIEPNRNLDFLKAHHLVLGYDWSITDVLKAKVELYGQFLYDLPVENDPNSYFATINETTDIDYRELVSYGEGKNYGVEVTLQRYFRNGYYLIANTSLYESKYTALDGVERNTRFNGNFVANLIAGKEFTNLGRKNNRTLAFNIRTLYAGGQKIIPLLRNEQGDLAVDLGAGQFWDVSKAYSRSLDDLFLITLSVSHKWQLSSATHELFLNLENITNNKGRISEFYDQSEPDNVGHLTQLGLLPNLMYRVYF